MNFNHPPPLSPHHILKEGGRGLDTPSVSVPRPLPPSSPEPSYPTGCWLVWVDWPWSKFKSAGSAKTPSYGHTSCRSELTHFPSTSRPLAIMGYRQSWIQGNPRNRAIMDTGNHGYRAIIDTGNHGYRQ